MLATARSLRAAGVSYVVAGVPPMSMVGLSRYVHPFLTDVGPDPREEPEAYVDFLLGVVRDHRIDLVFPVIDRTLLTCDRYREAIEAQARLAAPPSHAIRNVLDKRANLETARRLGIPCPRQFDLEAMDQVPAMIEELGFPMVLKNPGASMDGTRRRLDMTWKMVRNENELRRYLAAVSADGAFPLAQSPAAGVSRKLCCFAVKGRIVALHQWRHIRALHGKSAFRETTAVSPDLRRYAELLLSELEWEGMAHLEFFVRDSDGEVWYMETNGRPWGAIESSIGSGWDFPLWMYEYFTLGREPDPPAPTHAIGTRSRWHFGDLQVLLGSLRGAEEFGWEGRTRAGAVIDYLAGFSTKIHPDVFRLDDPLPELAEHARWVKVVTLARVGGAARRVSAATTALAFK